MLGDAHSTGRHIEDGEEDRPRLKRTPARPPHYGSLAGCQHAHALSSCPRGMASAQDQRAADDALLDALQRRLKDDGVVARSVGMNLLSSLVTAQDFVS